MGIGNILILTQVVAYILVVIFSLFMFIPISVNLGQFKGHCLLNAEGTWNVSLAEPKLNVTSWGLDANCNFPIFIGVISFPFALFYVLWMSIYLLRGTEPSWLAAFTSVLLNSVLCVLVLVCASIITHGFDRWCSLIDEQFKCEDADYVQILTDTSIESRYFYAQYEVSLFGAWTSWICWIVLAGCAGLQLYKYHQNEDFMTSMTRERQRLIQRVKDRDNVSI